MGISNPPPSPAPGAQLLTPERFGAKGDGVLDDTTALQSLLNEGGDLYFKNTYRISAALTIPNPHTRIYGIPGFPSRVVQADPTLHGILPGANATNLHIEGITLDGSSTTSQTDVTGLTVSDASYVNRCSFGGWNSCMTLRGGSVIERNRITSAVGTASGQGYGVLLLGPECIVVKNRMLGVMRHGVYLSGNATYGGASRSVVSQNVITMQDAGSDAVKLFALSTQGAVRDALVADNILRHVNPAAGTANGVGIYANCHNNLVRGNLIVDTNSSAMKTTGDSTAQPRNNAFLNNHVDSAAGFFIRVETLGGGSGRPVDNFFVGNSTNRIAGVAITDDGTGSIIKNNGLYPDTEPLRSLLNANSGTPTVFNGQLFRTVNTLATLVTHFNDGRDTQRIVVHVTDSLTTFVHGTTAGTGLRLSGAANYAAPVNAVLSFIRLGGVWYETGRSAN